MTFFSHPPQISNFPSMFPVFVHSPCFRKIIISPLLSKMSPLFSKIHLLFTYFMCISFSPYFDHACIYASPNARTGRLWSCLPVTLYSVTTSLSRLSFFTPVSYPAVCRRILEWLRSRPLDCEVRGSNPARAEI